MAYGTVVIAGQVYEIAGLRLRDGLLLITARGYGPSPEVRDAPATVFGEDGRGVCQAWHIRIPRLGRHQDVTIELPIHITEVEDQDGECVIAWK